MQRPEEECKTTYYFQYFSFIIREILSRFRQITWPHSSLVNPARDSIEGFDFLLLAYSYIPITTIFHFNFHNISHFLSFPFFFVSNQYLSFTPLSHPQGVWYKHYNFTDNKEKFEKSVLQVLLLQTRYVNYLGWLAKQLKKLESESEIRIRINTYQWQHNILPSKVHKQQLIPGQTLPTPTQKTKTPESIEKFP